MLNLHRVLLCTCINLDDVMQIDCLALSILFSIVFHRLVTKFGIVKVCDYRGTPQISPIYMYQKSEFLILIFIRIICEF